MTAISPTEAAAPAKARDSASSVAVLITVITSLASAVIALTAMQTWHALTNQPTTFAIFTAVTIALALVVVEVYGRGTVSFAGSGRLAIGFALGVGPGVVVAVVSAVLTSVHRRAPVHKALFDAANHALAVAAGAAVFHVMVYSDWSALALLGPALVAGMAYFVVNIGLLCLVMSFSEGTGVRAIFAERFRWFTPYYLASGPLALALLVAYDRVGVTGLIAFALPPALMMLSVHQYVARTRQSVEEVRRANADLQRANVQLAERNEDLHALFQFAGGLAARAHDRSELVSYAEQALGRLAGGAPRVHIGSDDYGVPLLSGGTRVGGLELAGHGLDVERWERLREAILPQLATAIESSELIEQVRKTHLATIAALSRSMEAKDYYTGGHTERVSDVSVALAKRLGYSGNELDALEIGALLHDIGKIGIPERILHKPGELDDDEWKVMREHPIISEYILSGVDLPQIVLHIARHSHESFDGSGYPDGLAGEEIPLPARIVLVADAFDALTSDRPYRRGRHVRAALDEIRTHAGTQFCPRVVEVLDAVFREEPHLLGASSLRAVEVA